MERITKKEFCKILSDNESIFIGILYRDYGIAELEDCIEKYLDSPYDLTQHRKVESIGYLNIKFSCGSYLDLSNNPHETWICEHCGDFWSDYYQTFFPVIRAVLTWYDGYEEKYCHKFLYYLILPKYHEEVED